jgi:transposase
MKNAQMIPSQATTKSAPLYIAFELSNTRWKMMFSNGFKRRQRTIAAADLSALAQEISKARQHFKMAAGVRTYSCYEAGRDGFWIHRHLQGQGICNHVVDSSSIEVNRRFRRAKTDRIDVGKLMDMLIRYLNGEQKLWSVLRVPTVEQEDHRRIQREVDRLSKERTAHSNRIGSLLVLHGIKLKVGRDLSQCLDRLRLWDASGLGECLKGEIRRELARHQLIGEQLKQLEQQKKQLLQQGGQAAQKVERLRLVRGIGPIGSWTLVYEFFGWRSFKNVKQVGAGSGLAPTPYDSGQSKREQGISKAGNARIRKLMTQLSWQWLRYQPYSQLSQWYMQRFGGGASRMRRVGIIALARKLLVALWKFLQSGLVPQGAIVSAAKA